MTTNPQVRARFIGGFILLLLGSWVLHSFMLLLIWAVVLALSTWSIYERLLATHRLSKIGVAIGLTLVIGAVMLVPLAYCLNRLLQEAKTLEQLLTHIQQVGMPAPDWLATVPFVGHRLSNGWMAILGSHDAAKASLQWLMTSDVFSYSKDIAGQLMQRFFGFLTVLLTLFFVYQQGDNLASQVVASSHKLFGEKGVRYLLHATHTVRATVNGMVLIGLSKGVLLGLAYAFVGLSNPALLGALTGIFALIPFAAKLIFGACSLFLLADGQLAAGTGLFVYGMILTMIADNYVRPALIGGAIKLPFIWTLLGIFGGMENLGLLGLFLGPALMAVLMSIWRDWLSDMNKPPQLIN